MANGSLSNWVERKHDVYLCNPCRISCKIVSLTYTLYPNILMICFSTSFLVSHDLGHSVKTRIWAARAWFAVTQHHQLQQCHPRMLGGLEGGSLRAGEPVAGGRTGRTSPNTMNMINTLYIYTHIFTPYFQTHRFDSLPFFVPVAQSYISHFSALSSPGMCSTRPLGP